MKKKLVSTICALGLASIFSGNVKADDAECGIWLCMPSGFPSAAGCAASQAAMLSRIKDLKPPLPAFSSCSASGSDEGHSFNHGRAAYIPPRRVCDKAGYRGDGYVCLSFRNVPAEYVEGTTCRAHHESGIYEPRGCTRTYRYVKIFANGEQEGETYYW